MKTPFKVKQRIKRGMLRGTVLAVLKAQGLTEYVARMDNGVYVRGTTHQFQPVRVAR